MNTPRDPMTLRGPLTRDSLTLRDPREVIREEMAMHAPIRAALEGGPLTVPEIAARIGHPREEVMFWVMGMRRYGHLVEAGEPDEEGYFPYLATGKGGGR